ncbi:dual specificity protein phosphatase 2 [Pygocentrus nattereri]|uniref:Protein-serine/threonine phosphatase n=1 Tax=Pygocentrus nattereri TaxID=42514 RepID=A0AAR2LB41_PYGNA|nr:dual specificity protein phosphatase 2 [Pygocentrus nattereri]
MPMEITSLELAQMVRAHCALPLLLDCRPFLAFCGARVACSHSVNWNSVLMRRERARAGSGMGVGSARPLERMVADRALLRRLRAGECARVVVLDEASRSVRELRRESVAGLLLRALQEELREDSTEVCFLQGGFDEFAALYPDLCLNTPLMCGSPTAVSDPETICSTKTTPLYDQGDPVEILPFLFLGSAHHSSRRETLERCGITAVLNVSSSCPNLFEQELQYMTLRVEDSLAADIRVLFPEAIRFIDSVKESGGRVLVHCQAGISRSATICLAYLIHARRVRLDEAFDFVKRRRQVISPNLAFMGQLLQFETDVLRPYTVLDSKSSSSVF